MSLKTTKRGYKYFVEKGKLVYVHRRVAEKKLKGTIFKGYEVHHKDGDKNNNRPSNLTVLKRSVHRKLHARGFWSR